MKLDFIRVYHQFRWLGVNPSFWWWFSMAWGSPEILGENRRKSPEICHEIPRYGNVALPNAILGKSAASYFGDLGHPSRCVHGHVILRPLRCASMAKPPFLFSSSEQSRISGSVPGLKWGFSYQWLAWFRGQISVLLAANSNRLLWYHGNSTIQTHQNADLMG